jgi:predicted transcriptional regulator
MTFQELRERKGFTNGTALARTAWVDQKTISNLDRGRNPDPRYSTVEALSKALRVTPKVLMQAIRESAKQVAA